MARQRTKYKLIGRYMNGKDTIYYVLISEDGKEVQYSEEQMAFLVGREQVINVSAQLYRNKILFRGIGCNITELPTKQINEPVTKNKQKCNTPEKTIRNKYNTIKNTCTDSITKKLYSIICNNKDFQILNDYEINYKYDEASNRLYIREKFNPSFGLDLIQNFFNDDDKEQQIVITDNGKDFHVYINKELALKTKDTLLVLNILNIVDNKFKLIETLDASSDIIVSSFAHFCGSAGWVELVELFKDENSIEYNSCTPIYFLMICIMEMKYASVERKRQDLNTTYNGYIFRGQGNDKINYKDTSFKSSTTSMNVAQQYGKDGIILAIKGVRLNNIIDVREAASYDKDFIYYEHEVLIRDFSKITIGNQIGTLKGIPIHKAVLDIPKCNRMKLIKDKVIQKYGNKKQLHIILHIINNIKAIYNIEETSYDSITIYGINDNQVLIEFDDDDNVIMNNIKCDNIQDIIREYNNIIY